MTKNTHPNLGTDSIPRLMLSFALPAIIGLLINASYNLVDRIFIGNGIGSLGLAGITVCFPTVVLQMALGLMVGVGGSVNFAVCLGQNKIGQDEEKSCVYRRDMETRRSVFQRNGGRVLPEHLQDDPRLRRRGDCRHAGFVRLFRAG